MKIASWNINSARLRLDQILRLGREAAPDVICLQEIKCRTELFPGLDLAGAGYAYQAVRGQPGYNGVAILSKTPLREITTLDHGAAGDARHISARLACGLTIHNVYIPAGGDIPDAAQNPKFDHKLRFLEALLRWSEKRPRETVVLGDFNIAPMEHDVWSHKALLDVVSHTPIETDRLNDIQAAGGWIDSARRFTPHNEKLYSWWSYRALDWDAADKGRRLDHLWLSPDLAEALAGVETLRAARGWDRPSDHVPVTATLRL